MSSFKSHFLTLTFALLSSSAFATNEDLSVPLPKQSYEQLVDKTVPYQPDYSTLYERIKNIWHAPNYFVALPVNTYHSRLTYSKERIDEYNEMPWGLGIGKWYRDKNNTRHQLVLLGFSDSNAKLQLLAGYTWQKDIYLNEAEDLIFGYGCDFFITARDDYYYIPFPGFTPEISIQYKNFAISTSWVPWLGPDYGNVFLTNIRWYF